MTGKARKTIELETVKRMANTQLARKDSTTEARKAVAGMLEAILFAADAYQGYNHVYWAAEGGYDAWVADGKPEGAEKNQYIYGGDGTDNYRRRYN